MERYDYKEAVLDDVRDYIDNYISLRDYESLDELKEHLNDTLWTDDSVTGNGSGSYFFNTWKAEEAICHNMDLLEEALREFGCDIEYLKNGAESCDVTIRCYLLSGAIAEALEEIEDEFEEMHREDEEEC